MSELRKPVRNRTTRVLVTYGWVRSSYAVLRNLTRHGYSVYVADCFRAGMCQWSRYVSGFRQYPSHYVSEERFITALADICNEFEIDYIFPSHNETEILAKYRDRFSPELSALLPDYRSSALFNNKSHAYDLASSVGLPVPRRIEYSDPSELHARIRESGVERTVIKLLTGNSSKGVFYADSPSAAKDVVERLIDRYRLERERFPQVEERVFGEGWGSSVLYWQGQNIAHFTHKRLREKISTGGTSTLREARQNTKLAAAADALFSKVGWHGLAMAEFKVCPRTGRYWFIEVNPRLWGSLPLAVAAGVEFPYLALLCATLGPDAAKNYFSQGVVRDNWRSRWLLGDTMALVQDLQRFGIRRTNDCFTRADSLDDFFWDDPLPFVGQICRYAWGAFAKRSLNAVEDGMLK